MSSVSKISSGAVVVPPVRRLRAPVAGVDLNFCRNPACARYGVLPDPFKRPKGSPPAPASVPRGAGPEGKHKEFYKCPACRTTSRAKNNQAVVEEHKRMRRLRNIDPCAPACRTAGCANQDPLEPGRADVRRPKCFDQARTRKESEIPHRIAPWIHPSLRRLLDGNRTGPGFRPSRHETVRGG